MAQLALKDDGSEDGDRGIDERSELEAWASASDAAALAIAKQDDQTSNYLPSAYRLSWDEDRSMPLFALAHTAAKL